MSFQNLMITTAQEVLPRMSNYKNEFETMKEMVEEISKSTHYRKMIAEWMAEEFGQSQNKSHDEITRESNSLREGGNILFRTKKEKRNILAACRMYTRAIFAAPCASESLAFGHANRAMALQTYGYFEQAYDDCVYALNTGYPKNLTHKLLMRQACCALQLRDAVRLERHLNALDEMSMSLNDGFQKQVKELREGLQHLQQQQVPPSKFTDIPLNGEKQKILISTSKGRYMVATQSIEEDELIFEERAPSFVPVQDKQICQQCAATQLIPFPCMQCHGHVIYCSLKCQTMHASVHLIECPGYRRNLFTNVGISHLALRMVLDGLPQAMEVLRSKNNSRKIWSELMDCPERVAYGQSLRMITHLQEMPMRDIVWFAVVADILVYYLREYTDFFKFVDTTTASQNDWEVIIGALILRHTGQLICNGHACVSIVPKSQTQKLNFPLMADDLWDHAFHVRRGQLHKFGAFDDVAAANFPYLSICNHSCSSSLRPKFSGRHVYTFAAKKIEADEEICNCYTLDYRKAAHSDRCNELKNIYKFDCECPKCKRPHPDEDFLIFHRYCCESCRQVFVPCLSQVDWWRSDSTKLLKCPNCGTEQRYQWFDKFNHLLDCVHSAFNRRLLYKIYDDSGNWLLDYNEIKMYMAFQLVLNGFSAHNDGSFLTDGEFAKLAEMIKFYLQGIAEKSSINSIEYVVKLAYLWDMIALGKCKCTKVEMEDMIRALDVISDEFQNIFMNYYKDFIVPSFVT